MRARDWIGRSTDSPGRRCACTSALFLGGGKFCARTSALFLGGGKFCAGYNQIARSNNQPRGAVESNFDLATTGKFVCLCTYVCI